MKFLYTWYKIVCCWQIQDIREWHFRGTMVITMFAFHILFLYYLQNCVKAIILDKIITFITMNNYHQASCQFSCQTFWQEGNVLHLIYFYRLFPNQQLNCQGLERTKRSLYLSMLSYYLMYIAHLLLKQNANICRHFTTCYYKI